MTSGLTAGRAGRGSSRAARGRRCCSRWRSSRCSRRRCGSLDLGQSDNGQLPADTTARQAYDMLSEGFGPGFNGPLLVAVSLGAATARRTGDAAAARCVAGSCPRRGSRGQPAAALEGPARDAVLTSLRRARRRRRRPRRSFTDCATRPIPAATRGTGLTAFVGGTTAGFIDLSTEISDRLPLVIAIVLASLIPAAADRVPRATRRAEGGGDEPAVDRRRVRRRHVRLRSRVERAAARHRRRLADRLVRPADDVRDPLRPLDGLRGVPDDARARALAGHRRCPHRRCRGARRDSAGDHVCGTDHGGRVLRVPAQRQPDDQAVRSRAWRPPSRSTRR